MKRNVLRVLNVIAFFLLMFFMALWVTGDEPVRGNPEVFFDIWVLGPITVLGWFLSSLMVWIDRLLTRYQPDI